MQSAFHMLRPTMNLAKAVGVIDRAANEEFLDGFLAVEKHLLRMGPRNTRLVQAKARELLDALGLPPHGSAGAVR